VLLLAHSIDTNIFLFRHVRQVGRSLKIGTLFVSFERDVDYKLSRVTNLVYVTMNLLSSRSCDDILIIAIFPIFFKASHFQVWHDLLLLDELPRKVNTLILVVKALDLHMQYDFLDLKFEF